MPMKRVVRRSERIERIVGVFARERDEAERALGEVQLRRRSITASIERLEARAVEARADPPPETVAVVGAVPASISAAVTRERLSAEIAARKKALAVFDERELKPAELRRAATRARCRALDLLIERGRAGERIDAARREVFLLDEHGIRRWGRRTAAGTTAQLP